jgi:hypothetical protein
MNWTDILKRQTLRDKIIASRKSGNFDEILANHGKSQIRRAINNLVEDGVHEKEFQPLLDKLGASKKDDDYKNPKEIKLYEDFLAGNHKPLISFLEGVTPSKSGAKISRLLKWDKENGDKIFNYIKDKPELYGYETEGITLQLPLTFDTDKLTDLKYVLDKQLTVTLPDSLSDKQGKLLSGGTPSKPIVRTSLGKVYRLPEYNDGEVASSQSLDASTISDSFAADYVRMVVTSIRGKAREPFMPNLSIHSSDNIKQVSRNMKEIMQDLFGADSGAGTSRIQPAIDYIMSNNTINLDVGFVKQQTKQSLQEKQLQTNIRDGLVENAEIVALYNKFVKTGQGNKKTGTAGYGQFKTAVYNADLGEDYEKLLTETKVRKYTMSEKLRDSLVAMMEGGASKEEQKLVKQELGYLFSRPLRTSVKRMTKGDTEYGNPEQILAALKEMRGKEGSVSIIDKQRIPTLQFLFEEVDNDPIGNYLTSRSGEGNKLKDPTLSHNQTLRFSDLLEAIVILEGYMLGDRVLDMALRRLRKNKDDEGIKTFKAQLTKSYGELHSELLVRIKNKMSQVMEEPILHNKKGAIQPFEWIASEGGRA